ncbi:MAG: extracellular solute-binding protein [Victivallaceae bacterium]|nr:extracellular solute-binding protein [Victivallaceae bacterium]
MSMTWKWVLIYIGMALFSLLIWWSMPRPVSNEKIPLSWLSWNGPERIRQADEFNQLNPDCSLTIDPNNMGVTKVVVQCSANMGGDIIDFVNQVNIQTYQSAGIIKDLTDDAKRLGFGLDTIPEQIHPLVCLKVLDENGNIKVRQYSYPLNLYHTYLIYNKDIFDKYGVPYPPYDLTWDKYIEIAQKLTIYRNPDDKVPEIFGAKGVIPMIPVWEKGGRIMNRDGTRCLLNGKAAVDALCFLHDLIYKYKVEPTETMVAGVTTSDGRKASYSWLCDNRLAMSFGARWYLMMMRPYFKERQQEIDAWKKAHPGEKYAGPKPYRFGACLVPRFKNGPRYTSCGGRCAALNAASPHVDQTLKFLSYAASRNYAQQIIDIADSKPPNKKFFRKELFYSREYPGEKEIHDLSIDSIKYGRMEELSPLIDNAVVSREFNELIGKIHSNRDLNRKDIQELADYSAEIINRKIAENIAKNKSLRKFYRKILQNGGEPALYYHEEKVKK